jgi:fructose-bisphosphate aldolase class I
MGNITLTDTTRQLIRDNKGLLAMDESTGTCNKRFAELGIPQTEAYRRKYRDLIVNAPQLENYISGAILADETTRQATEQGKLFIDILKEKGIIPGIKVDEGAIPMAGFPGEKITEGLDGLAERFKTYRQQGILFAKWRAVITIDAGIPTDTCINANAYLLARYAIICQEAGIVPIVEPEVIMDGNHSLEHCAEVTTRVLHSVFNALNQHKVQLDGMILKPNMILPGNDSLEKPGAKEVAEATLKCLLGTVPATVPGIAFLSGGQPAELATERLNTMHQFFDGHMPGCLLSRFRGPCSSTRLNYGTVKTKISPPRNVN